MSTRFYPRFVKGNPQLRIFLPDWKMVMIKSEEILSPNIVSFRVDPRMTDWDVKNYLEKIYKVQVGAVSSRIMSGRLITRDFMRARGEDYKIVRVTLPIGQKFEWPNLFPEEKLLEAKEEYEEMLGNYKKSKEGTKSSGDKPGWFM